jgi:hypothetical protein
MVLAASGFTAPRGAAYLFLAFILSLIALHYVLFSPSYNSPNALRHSHSSKLPSSTSQDGIITHDGINNYTNGLGPLQQRDWKTATFEDLKGQVSRDSVSISSPRANYYHSKLCGLRHLLPHVRMQ